jgi:hypothetical protein
MIGLVFKKSFSTAKRSRQARVPLPSSHPPENLQNVMAITEELRLCDNSSTQLCY